MPLTLSAEERERARKVRAAYHDPVRFARTFLAHDVWATPAAILDAIAQPRARVAVKACHASSKTFTAAEAVVWALARYKRVKVVTTAPTWLQVETLLWGEIHKAVASARVGFPSHPNTTDWTLEEGARFALGVSTNEPERFQGYHADEGGVALIVVDEAPGVRPAIFEAIEGIRAGGDVRVLMLGNPTIASGPFYEAFTSQRDHWRTFSIDAFQTPNLAGLTLERLLALDDDGLDDNARPYLVTRRWVRERYDEWGPEHPLWQARVRGEFPAQAEDALYSLAWLEAASRREPVTGGGSVEAGIDVAGPGDDETVLCVREGGSVLELRAWPHSDPRGEILAALQPYRRRLVTVRVDATGIGHFLAVWLQDQGLPVAFVNAGGAPADQERYVNAKAEMYWGLRMRLERGELAGLRDEKAIAQLAGVRYRHDARGRVAIESKDDARKRGVKSPDRAEGVVLAFAATPARRAGPVRLPGGYVIRGTAP